MERHHGESKPNGKTLRTRLQRQLEFYLSASNLRQDKFLQQSMDEQGFVPVALFLAFNKLKAMKATEKMVRDAVAKSSLIRMSADQSAIAPVELPFDTEDTSQERTVYIENFGVEDDHDSLRKRLSKFGKVNLVSMPRFPQSKRFKGFAFVEFASTQAAEALVAAALATDPELHGVRAMPKVQWQELKQQLKEQLASATPQGAAAEERGAASSTRIASVELHEEDDGEPTADNHTRASAPKKRKNGHIHFAADEEETVQQHSEVQDVTKKMKVL
ncbi:hypothetical protein Gpo141_00011361 [Globisporangium polare]